MHVYSFEKLEVWQLSREFNRYIYTITSKFPVEEKFGLVSQIRRASISIASNIAEGSARNTAKDQANFYGMAFSGAIEVLNQLIICNDLQYLSIGDYESGRKKIEEITNKLNGLRKTAIERQLSSKRINS